MDFFSLDSGFYKIMDRIGQCVLLSILWILFSLPVLTAGAATTALYYCAVKNLRKDQGSILRNFWDSFRQNFCQSTLAMLALVSVSLLFWLGGNVVQLVFHTPLQTIYFVLLLLGVLIIAWAHYVFSCIACFHSSLGTILKNSLVLCLWNLPKSLSMSLLLGIMLGGFILTLPRSIGTVLFLPGLYALLISFLLSSIYQKYIEATPKEE